MLRRSVSFRRMLAVALAGVALGACSNSAEDTTAPASDANLGPVNPLNFSISTSNLFFDFTSENAPAPQTVEVSGLVVTTTPYVRVLSINYSPSNMKDWLRITQRPALLSDGTLGVRLTFTTRYIPGLEQGATATVPITIPGARNGPQTITVSTNALNCAVAYTLPYPTPQGAMSFTTGDLQPTDCTSSYFPYGEGYRYFDLYAVTVPAGHTFQLDYRGDDSNAGTLSDPWLILFDPSVPGILSEDDDSGIGWDSRILWTNSTAQSKLYYLVLGAYYPPTEFGTYRLEVTDVGISTSPSFTLKAEPVTATELARKKAGPRPLQ